MMARVFRSGIFLSALIWAPVLVLAAACSKPATTVQPGTVQPGGTMNILGPVPAMVPNPLPDDWITEGNPGPGQLTVVERDGVPALKVVNGGRSFVAAKPAWASLLATPYLSWAWNMEPQNRGTHPVRLAIGFNGGNPDGRAGISGLGRSGARLPPMTGRLSLFGRSRPCSWAPSPNQNRPGRPRRQPVIRPGEDGKMPVPGCLKPWICRIFTAAPGPVTMPETSGSPSLASPPPEKRQALLIFRDFACPVSDLKEALAAKRPLQTRPH